MASIAMPTRNITQAHEKQKSDPFEAIPKPTSTPKVSTRKDRTPVVLDSIMALMEIAVKVRAAAIASEILVAIFMSVVCSVV